MMAEAEKKRSIFSLSPRLVMGGLRLLRYLFLHHFREVFVVTILVAVLALPFVMRGAVADQAPSGGERLTILTPHNGTIRREFGDAFSRHMREQLGRKVSIDWRNPGGTSEIARVIDSEFAASFENYGKKKTQVSWKERLKKFDPRRGATVTKKKALDQNARAEFLASNVGIGIDLFFGGGTYDFQVQAEKGHLVSQDHEERYGLGALVTEEPEWFKEDVLAMSFGGEPFRDPENRWVGTCLSSFGICFNRDGLQRLGIQKVPDAWEDLADPRLRGEVALADPSKSGSITKAFEMLIQQQMAIAVAQEVARAGQSELELSDEEIVRSALAQGWRNGLRIIQRIAANARYFTDSSSRIPLDVAQGNAVAGMCIDFYGRTFVELAAAGPGGVSRVGYASPPGGTSVGADPIGMFRGAPRPDLAHAFMRFVLSPEGQRLWNYRAGAPGGPSATSLRRLPVRQDAYLSEELVHFTDPEVLPYQSSSLFTYHPKWTAGAFDAIRFIVRLMCVDSHDELRESWRAIVAAGMPPDAVRIFEDLGMVNYGLAMGGIAETLSSGRKLEELRLARDLLDSFSGQYRRAARLARRSARPSLEK